MLSASQDFFLWCHHLQKYEVKRGHVGAQGDGILVNEEMYV